MALPGATDGLTFRQDYFGDPAGWRAISGLLMDVFGVDISPLDRLGGHDRSNMASAWFDADGRCVANFAAFSMPLMIDGTVIRAAGLQSGAVRPDYRGRGLFRDLTETVLSRCDAGGYEAVVLYTDKPGLYLPHGFRVVPQHRFCGTSPEPSVLKPSSRTLDMDRSDDLALMQRLLAGRTPVSQRFAVADQAKMFLLNTYLVDGARVSYLPDHDAAVAWGTNGDGAFELLDIVGAQIPSLADILAALDRPPERIEVYFPPDRLGWQGKPIQETGDLVFMMRCADELVPTEPFCLSPMAEF